MALLNIQNLLTELVVFARNNVTDPLSRGSNATETFSGNGIATQFTVANTNIKNISSLTISAVAQKEFRDFTVEYTGANKGRITFTTAPAVGVNNISVTYHYSDTWVHPEFPKTPQKLNDFPLLTIEQTSHRSEEIAIGGTALKTDILATMTAYSPDRWELSDLLNQFRQAVLNNKKNFALVPFVTVNGMPGPIAPSDRDARVLEGSVFIIALNKVEF